MKFCCNTPCSLVINPNSYFSSCQSVGGVFSSHTSSSFITQYVGVIFNHNITPFSSLNTHVFLFVQTSQIYGRLQFALDQFRFLSSLPVAGYFYQVSFFLSDYRCRSDQIFYWYFVLLSFITGLCANFASIFVELSFYFPWAIYSLIFPIYSQLVLSFLSC